VVRDRGDGMGTTTSAGTAPSGLIAQALDSTIAQPTSIYGSSDPDAWTCSRSNETGGRAAGSGQADGVRCNPSLDDIQFAALGAGKVPSMPWVNRPTFQQVVQFPAGRP
jgi:hypothetical protein